MRWKGHLFWLLPLPIALVLILVGVVLVAVGHPQWGGGLAGAAAFMLAATFGQQLWPGGRARGAPPPQMVDPGRTPPMRRGA
jgi:hypothetical protein